MARVQRGDEPDPVGLQAVSGAVAASEEDWGREFLDMVIAAKCVKNIDEAIEHIRKYGSQHTDCILTEDDGAAA
ncbi:MAG: hypothetical protein P8Y02_11030, partial [Deinococcales bacterium]